MNAIQTISKKTGVSEKTVLYGAAGLFGSFVIFGVGANIICNIIGVLYPAYCSFKAIESSEEDDDT